MFFHQLPVNPPALSHLGRQGVDRGQRRRLVDMHALEGDTLISLGHLRFWLVEIFSHLLHAHAEKRSGILEEIVDNKFVLVDGVLNQGNNRCYTTSFCAVHSGDVQYNFSCLQIEEVRSPVLATQLEIEIVEPGLKTLYQACHTDGCHDI